MGSSFWFDIINVGTVYFTYLGVSGYNFQQIFYEDLFLPLQSVLTLMKCSTMQHFIWGFTVCKITPLGVSRIQRVKIGISCMFFHTTKGAV